MEKGTSNYCLAVETTGAILGLGLAGGGTEEFWCAKEAVNRHSDLLISELRRLVGKAGINSRAISSVGVDTGPGSFTGIRIGVAFARALGQTLNIPVVGVPSLDIIAHEYAASHLTGEYKFICSMVAGLRDEVYAAVYQKKGSGVSAELRRISGYRLINKTLLDKWFNPRTDIGYENRDEKAQNIFDQKGEAHTLEYGQDFLDEKMKRFFVEFHNPMSVLGFKDLSVSGSVIAADGLPNVQTLSAIAKKMLQNSRNHNKFKYNKVLPFYVAPNIYGAC